MQIDNERTKKKLHTQTQTYPKNEKLQVIL